MSLGRRAVSNTLFNWLGTGVATVASIVLTPYLLHHLDAERFGLYQITRHVVTYLALFDFGILGAVMRYTSHAIAARDDARVNALVNGALVLYGGIAALGLLASGLLALVAPAFFGVTPAYAAETRWLFLGLGAWWALSMLTCPPRGILIGHQRYGLHSLVMAGSWVLTVVLVVVLFENGLVGLGPLAAAFVAGAACQFVGCTLIAQRIHRALAWGRRYIARATLGTLWKFGSWNLLFTISGLFLWSSDSIVIGRLLGPAFVPLYAVPFMLIHYGRIVAAGFTGQLTPVAAGHAAANDMAGLTTTVIRATRIGLILTLAGNGLLIVLAEDLLRLWVGPELAPGWIIYAYLMSSFWAVYAQRPIYHILLGAGDIRRPALVVLSATAATLVLKIVALGQFGLGIEAVALLNCVLVLPVMLVYVPWCGCRLAGISLGRLYREAYLGPILAFLPVAGAGVWLVRALPPLDLLGFALALALLAGSYLALALLTLSAAERAGIRQTLGRLWRITPLSRGTTSGRI